MKLSEILKDTEYQAFGIDPDAEVEDLSLTQRNSNCKTAVIIPGERVPTGIRFSELRALCVICGEDIAVPEGIATVRVEKPRRAMAFAYSRFYGIDYGKLRIIGITGTNGKTSTATFTEKALSVIGKVGFIGTGKIRIGGISVEEEFYSMTTPDPPLLYKVLKRMEDEGCFAVVMEVSSHALALCKVDPIPFEYAVMTNLSDEHLDFHKTKEEYFLCKARLFSMCKNAVLNLDDGYARRIYRELGTRCISVGALFKGDAFASSISDLGFDGVSYIYNGKGYRFRMNLKTPGIYNIYNSLLAIAVATDMGAPPFMVKEALSGLDAIEGRYEIIKDEITVIIDYAHTDTAMECLLKGIYAVKGSNPLTVIFGAGGDRDRSKRPRMASISEKYADKIIITQDNSRSEDPMDIVTDIVRGFKTKSCRISLDRAYAIREAILSAVRGEVIAIIGKGAEKYNIDKLGYHRFDEKAIIKDALEERKKKCE